jgi:hypothetical protein
MLDVRTRISASRAAILSSAPPLLDANALLLYCEQFQDGEDNEAQRNGEVDAMRDALHTCNPGNRLKTWHLRAANTAADSWHAAGTIPDPNRYNGNVKAASHDDYTLKQSAIA